MIQSRACMSIKKRDAPHRELRSVGPAVLALGGYQNNTKVGRVCQSFFFLRKNNRSKKNTKVGSGEEPVANA